MSKTFFKNLLLAGAPFGVFLGALFALLKGPLMGIVTGIIAGLLFGIIMSIFVIAQNNKFQKLGTEITGGKEIVFSGGANHFVGREAVGGWLCLTKDEIIFLSHSYNVQKHKMILPLSEVTDIKRTATLGVVPNGLQIQTSRGTIEKFVVNERSKWIEKINNVKNH